MPSPRNASAFSSFTTICSGVCFENFLMVIHSARPQTAGTTQNNPLTTNGPKNPDPSRARRQERSGNLESHNRKDNGLNAPTQKPGLDGLIKWRCHAGRYTRCVVLHRLCGATPDQNGCNAHGSGVPGSQTGTIAEPGIPQYERKGHQHPPTHNPGLGRLVKRRRHAGHCTRCVALHPLRGATPVTWSYTRSERVQCPRIGCTGLADRNDCGTWNPAIRKKAASTTPHT